MTYRDRLESLLFSCDPLVSELITTSWKPTDRLKKIVETLFPGIAPKYTCSLERINDIFQEAYFEKQRGLYRYQVRALAVENHDRQAPHLLPMMLNARSTQTVEFTPNVVLILGAIVSHVAYRAEYAAKCFPDVAEWAFLSSVNRKLIEKELNFIKEKCMSADGVDTEYDGIQCMFSSEDNIKAIFNEDAKVIKTFTNANKRLVNFNQEGKKPTTFDTVQQYIKDVGKYSIPRLKIAVASSQPHVGYQVLSVFNAFLQEGVMPLKLVGIGPAFEGDIRSIEMGGDLAKTIYTLLEIKKKLYEQK